MNNFQILYYRIKLKLIYFCNKRKNKPIFYKSNSKFRGIGMTTCVVKTAISMNLPIIVETEAQKKIILNMKEKMGYKQPLFVFSSTNDIRGNKLMGPGQWVLIDCGEKGLRTVYDNGLMIYNGFCCGQEEGI